jgi:hypothetical protein
MGKKVYQTYERDQITDDMLHEAALLFSNNYGVWNEKASKIVGPFAKQGATSQAFSTASTDEV